MSATILQFPKKPKPRAPERTSEMICTRCAASTFHISGEGIVHCERCNARMQNLHAVLTKGAA